jgi:bacterioferritin-associated ferredoxin
MILCHCKGVSDKSVRSAIRCGASSVRDVARACGAGTGCGGCRPLIQELIRTEQHGTSRPVSAAIGDLAPTK